MIYHFYTQEGKCLDIILIEESDKPDKPENLKKYNREFFKMSNDSDTIYCCDHKENPKLLYTNTWHTINGCPNKLRD